MYVSLEKNCSNKIEAYYIDSFFLLDLYFCLNADI